MWNRQKTWDRRRETVDARQETEIVRQETWDRDRRREKEDTETGGTRQDMWNRRQKMWDRRQMTRNRRSEAKQFLEVFCCTKNLAVLVFSGLSGQVPNNADQWPLKVSNSGGQFRLVTCRRWPGWRPQLWGQGGDLEQNQSYGNRLPQKLSANLCCPFGLSIGYCWDLGRGGSSWDCQTWEREAHVVTFSALLFAPFSGTLGPRFLRLRL